MAKPIGNYFAALPVRAPADLLDSLRRSAPPFLRWFHPLDLHLTLAFFGREDPLRVPVILDLLNQIPFRESRAGLGTLRPLPRPRRFSALSFELLDGHEDITRCIATWRDPLLRAAARDPDPRPPLAHLTIARPDRKHPDFRPGRILTWIQSLPPVTKTVLVLPPALYGWSPDRPQRQFRVIPPP